MTAPESIVFHVARPPADVFPYVADLLKAPQWVPDLVSMQKITAGEVGVGTRYREVVRMGGRESSAELEVTEYRPPHLFALRGEGGPSRFTGRFVLEPDGDGTRVTHEYTVRMVGLGRVLEPLVRGRVRRNAEAAVRGLRRALEGR